MPGHVDIDPCQKLSDLSQFLVTVVKPGNEQGGHLHPDAPVATLRDGVKHRLQSPPADAAVEVVAEGLEVDIYR
jgi:hypothetical protein